MTKKTAFLVVVLVLAGLGYLYTMAPTVSFWDCGEYIAVAFALGVPHPPGTPFFCIFGRFWIVIWRIVSAILPVSREVAWHMNLTAVISSLIALAFVYVITLKLLKRWRRDDNSIVPFVGAFAATLALAFSYTFWDNSIETEMYGAATAVSLFITWLGLRWHEDYEKNINQHQFVLFIFYLVFLSSGIHLAAFLTVIPLYVFMILVDRKFTKDLNFWLIGLFVVVSFFSLFIASDQLFEPSIIFLGILLVGSLIITLGFAGRYKNNILFWVGVLVVVIGISTEAYLVIRSHVLTQQYVAKVASASKINECNPSDFKLFLEGKGSFYDVLHRKQYEPMSFLPRRTQLETGMNAGEGYFWQIWLYFRYFSWQFISENAPRGLSLLVFLIFLCFGTWGIYENYKHNKKIFVFLFLLFLMTSFAMATYLNLKFSPSDPNPQHQPREVRERDYFFRPGFAYFAVFLGVGFVAFLDWAKRYFRRIKFAPYVGMVLIVALSIVPFITHFSEKNRYGNWIPRDYGYNMLSCCEDNSLVFTNGDNDTFPLWFIQDVLRYRRSVVIANLSLINTDWYIKQLKYWGAPISFSDRIISMLYPVRAPDGRVVLVKDIMVRNILATNAGLEVEDYDYLIPQAEFIKKYVKNRKGKMTIYFATTVSDDNLEGLKPYVRLEGLVYRVVPDSLVEPQGNIPTNVVETQDLFFNTMRYTGIFEREDFPFLSRIIPDFKKRQKDGEFMNYRVLKDENTRRLLSNYAAGLFSLGLAYQQMGLINKTKEVWQWALLFRPQGAFPFIYNLSLLYAYTGNFDSSLIYLRQLENRGIKDAGVYFRIAGCYQALGNGTKMEEYLRKAIAAQPRFREAYEALAGHYVNISNIDKAIAVLRDWLVVMPNDTAAQRMIDRLSAGVLPNK